ncbi:hypothetical protein Pmani_035836 [Petrolisthes manimaculis]|uniref:Uncharacterized protein n=1 Tax=Petrolisthes manimaculis TaxID=1843537 RepID=A0AAE1NKZ2_9EUCA|nr:hypothetical protein Pmani_035836 [Petrolisthes manimaculis]
MMVSRGFWCLLMMSVVCSVSQATQPLLQEVQVESPGLKHTPLSDAVEWIPQDWQPLKTRNTNTNTLITTIQKQQKKNTDSTQDVKEANNNHETSTDPWKQQQHKEENQIGEISTLKTREREGRMLDMAKKDGLLDDYENNNDDGKERQFLGTTGNQQVTISLNGLVSGILYTLLGILLFHLIFGIFTGSDMRSWGKWATDMYHFNRNYPHYNFDDMSTYTAYRSFNEASEKYDDN